jgi:dienelactone hydrolase
MQAVQKITLVSFALFMFACADEPEPQQTSPAESGSEMDIRGEEVAYMLDEVSLTGYIAYDANQEGPRPGIIVVHQWWGHSDYVRQRADMLAEMGYTAFALDMYGDGKFAVHPEDAQKFMMEIVNNMDVAVNRFEEAKRLLEQHPSTDPTLIAAIGYCFGGGVVLHMARIGSDLDGVASFHGGLVSGATAEAGTTKADILVLNGADDPWTTAEQIAAFEQEMDEAGVSMKFVNYPGAVHGFTDPGATERGQQFELPLAYNEQADKESWEEFTRFLDEIF